jgi:(2Fe-2S) ferredoxin
MAKPVCHVFVCTQQRPQGHPRGACQQKGAAELLQALWAELQRRAAYERVAITYSGCLGPCDAGANVLVYPEGVLYSGVKKEDVAEIFDRHLEGGQPVERLLAPVAVWG